MSNFLRASSSSSRTTAAGGGGQFPEENAMKMSEPKLSHRDKIQRELEEETGTCMCTDNDTPITIQMLSVGAPDHPLHFIPERFTRRAEEFKNRTGVEVKVIQLGDLDVLNEEIFADVQAKVYDGYMFLPFITGDLVEAGGLADLTDFVRTNQETEWTDIFPFNREVQSVYDNVVRLIPCDGDVHSLYYRTDLFELYNKTVPRTWDEYSETAAFFNGMTVPNGLGENVTLAGSCVGRGPSCLDFRFWNILVHSTSTQATGTNTGALFSGQTFQPLMGEALAETLRHLENQVKYGPEEELTTDKCINLNIEEMNQGRCAMTYNWGNSFANHLLEGSVIGGKLGVAPTPGVTRVLDRDTGRLVNCNEKICPHGETYDDIGRVNRAPYAAAGGWSTAVSAGVSPARRDAMADFFGFVCGKDESIKDVVPLAKGEQVAAADPYRRSHFDVDGWVEQGFPRDATEQYFQTLDDELSSPNAVLDVRFPKADMFLTVMDAKIREYLTESMVMDKTFEDRMAVSKSISDAWLQITEDYDNSGASALTLKEIYQKSLNVYVPRDEGADGLSTGAIVGIVIGCSAFVAIVVGLVAHFLLRGERKKSKGQWEIKREDLRLTGEVLGEGSFGVITKGFIMGTPVAVKTTSLQCGRVGTSDLGSGFLSSDTTVTSTERVQRVHKQSHMEEELLVLVKLRHPHLVQTLGAMLEKKTVFVVFEFMANGNLSTVLADHSSRGVAGRTGSAFELQWALQIAEGLQFLHSVAPPLGPLIHGDLRASNVLLDSSYVAKLSNFSLEAQALGSPYDQSSLLWTAPEVLNGAKASAESDVYSYGMTLYEVISGSKPFLVRCFDGDNMTEMTASTLTDPFASSVVTDAGEGEILLKPKEEDISECFGVYKGIRTTVPEIVSQVSDLTLEPALRPDLTDLRSEAPQILRDLCAEGWHKNLLRRPQISEILERLSAAVNPSSLTQQLFDRGSVFETLLPHHVREALSRGETVPPENFEEVTVIFSDIVGFTSTSSKLTAEEVGDLISRLFTKFDRIAKKYDVKKLDVIGDAFLGVCGIPKKANDHAVRAACFALESIAIAERTLICPAKPELGYVSIRFGLATGPVVATVIGGANHPKYTLFGTTVNTASRMESSSEPNRVQCTTETADLIKEIIPALGVTYRKKMDIKGRGEMDTYFLSAPSEGFASMTEFTNSKWKGSKKKRRRQLKLQSSTGSADYLSDDKSSTDQTSFDRGESSVSEVGGQSDFNS